MLRSLKPIFAILIIGGMLQACSSVPLSSLPKLRGLKAETMDMSQLEMAVRLQENMGIAKDGAVLTMDIRNHVSGERLSQEMILQAPNPELTKYLLKQQKPGYRIYRFKLTGDQLAEAQTFRTKALDLDARATGQKNNGTFEANAQLCSHVEGTVFDQAKMTFYIRTKSDKEFFMLFKEQTMALRDKAGEAVVLPVCGA